MCNEIDLNSFCSYHCSVPDFHHSGRIGVTGTALILAPNDGGLQQVFGLPVVRRLVLLMRGAGIETVQIVSRNESILATPSGLISPDVRHVVRDAEELDDVVSKIIVGRHERVLVARADLVVDRRSLSLLVQAAERSADEECIYVLRSGEGSHLEGIYAAGNDALASVAHAIWSSETSDSAILEKAEWLAAAPGLPCIAGGEHTSVRRAEERLIAALPLATADRDGFMARHLDRHFSRRISRKLARTGVIPNQITLFNVAIGFAGAFFLARGSYWSQLGGSLLFLLCVVLDGVDGEVARLKLKESVFGHYLDVITDNLVHVAIFVGIAVGLCYQTGNRGYLYALGFLLGGFGLCACVVRRTLNRCPDRARSGTTSKLIGLLANRDFAYLVVAFAIVGHLNWFLLAAAAGTYVFAATLWVLDKSSAAQPVSPCP